MTSGIYWLASYPKSGNTWFRSFLFNLRQNNDAPADINELPTGCIASARWWLDETLGFDTAELDHDEVERLRPEVYRWSLRKDEIGYHKIHDAYSFTSDSEPLVGREATLGALYILRNPLDIAPSAASHVGLTIDEIIRRMGDHKMSLTNDHKSLSPQVRQKLFTWSGHVLSWVDAPELNCHVIRYEDMLNAPIETFTSASRFLQLPIESGRIEKAIRFSDFKILSEQETNKGIKERSEKAKRFFGKVKQGGAIY